MIIVVRFLKWRVRRLGRRLVMSRRSGHRSFRVNGSRALRLSGIGTLYNWFLRISVLRLRRRLRSVLLIGLGMRRM